MDDSGRRDHGDYGATRQLVRPDLGAPQAQAGQLRPGQPPAPQGTPPRRGIPIWVWLLGAGGLLVFAVAALLVIFVLFRQVGFNMVVRGAPPGSDVYVDNISRGVTAADGSIKVPSLKAGKRVVRVSHDGYVDFNTTVTGQDGDVKIIVAQLTSSSTSEVKPQTLPKEIDYKGPMVLVGAGEFVMGDNDHYPDEKPAHKVSLPDFYIDKFEVTNQQYKQFCDETKHPLPPNPFWDLNYFSDHLQAPVLGVSWHDAVAYARWAGKRLPTEEEWEKAASWDPTAGKKRIWPWGDDADASRANVGQTSGAVHTTNVDQFPTGASAYGVQGLTGNAAEWVDSFYQAYPGNTVANPQFGTKNRVVRGSSYYGGIEDARNARRLYHEADLSSSERARGAFLIGFRCAVSANDPKLQEHLRVR